MHGHLIFITGVAASGKTTVGQLLAQKTGLLFADGDDFHPPANLQKMSGGQPLDDDDRADWLEKINQFGKSTLASGGEGCIIACSALKEKYRKTLSQGIENQTVWVFLQGDFDTVRSRIEQRTNHFMPPDLLHSQFQILEPPAEAFTCDISLPPDEIAEQIFKFLKK